jgi:hypothetical protein
MASWLSQAASLSRTIFVRSLASFPFSAGDFDKALTGLPLSHTRTHTHTNTHKLSLSRARAPLLLPANRLLQDTVQRVSGNTVQRVSGALATSQFGDYSRAAASWLSGAQRPCVEGVVGRRMAGPKASSLWGYCLDCRPRRARGFPPRPVCASARFLGSAFAPRHGVWPWYLARCDSTSFPSLSSTNWTGARSPSRTHSLMVRGRIYLSARENAGSRYNNDMIFIFRACHAREATATQRGSLVTPAHHLQARGCPGTYDFKS